MKKYLFAIFAFTIALGVFAQVLPSFASGVYLPVQGGTGTSSTPQSGEILIGNGSGTYTPAYIVCTGSCSTATSSGGFTINVTGSGGGSSTVLYAGPYIMLTASGTNGYVVSNIGVLSLASSSDIGVSNATGTGVSFSFLNPKGFTTTTIQSVLNALSGTGLASYNSSTGVFSVSSSSLNLGTASHYSFSDFLPSSTAYVSSFNTRTGAVTLTSADVTTALGYTPLSGNQTITIIATGDATGTASGATTITHNLTITGLEGKALPSLATGTLKYTGGAWTFDGNTYLLSGVNVTTTAPLSGGGPLTSAGLILTCSSCLTGNQTITLTGAVTGSGATSIATTYTTSTLYGFFSATGPIVYSSATGAFSWTNSNNYISSISINGNAGTSFTVGAGSGITSTVAGTATTITLNLNAICSGNNFLSGVSATGTGICGTPSGGASSTNVYGISPIVVSQVGVNATASCPTCQYGTGTIGYLLLSNGLQTVTSSIVSQSGTLIGINTSTPFAPLDVLNPSGSDILRLTDSGGRSIGLGTQSFTNTLSILGGSTLTSAAKVQAAGLFLGNSYEESPAIGHIDTASGTDLDENARGQASINLEIASNTVENVSSTGITVYGNATTTNETVSSTLTYYEVNASGTVNYQTYVDSSGFLHYLCNGTIPGTSPIPYCLYEFDSPTLGSSASSGEVTFSQSLPFADGSRTFSDWTTEQYPPTFLSGWFETATGASGSSSQLYPFGLTFTPQGGGHHTVFQVTPVNATGTWNGATFALTGNTTVNGTMSEGSTTITGAASTTGNLAVGASETIASGLTIAGGGANINGNITATGTENLYSTGNGAMNTFRASTSNYDTQCVGTGVTAWWCEQLNPNGTNNLQIVDSQDGGAALTANINGSTTIGNSGTGVGIILGSAATASTTLTVNQTSTFNGKVVVASNDLEDANGNKYSTSTASGGSGTVSTSSALVSGDVTLNTGTSTIGNSLISQTGTSVTVNASATAYSGEYNSTYYQNATATTASTQINWKLGNVQGITIASNTQFSFMNNVAGGRYVLMILQDATGGRLGTWATSTPSINWPSSNAPVLSVASNTMDIMSFVCGPTNCYGGYNYSYAP